MGKGKGHAADAAELRRRAEEQLGETDADRDPTMLETQRTVHELQVHKIELEMQNEELRCAQAEVRCGLDRYTELYDSAPVGYVTLDRDGAIRQLNLAAARLLGNDRDGLVGARFGFFLSDAGRADWAAFLKRVFAANAHVSCELTLGGEDRESLDVKIDAVATGDGQECHIVLVDITQRKQAEQALERSQRRLEMVLRAGKIGAWDLDLVTGAVWHSIEHDHIFGYEALLSKWTYEDFLGHVFSEDRAEMDRRFHEALATGEEWECECRICRPDGAVRWIWTMAQALYAQDGAPLRMYGVVRDITDRRQAEDALRASEKFQVAVLNSMAAHIAVLDRTGRIVAVNEPWLRFARENGPVDLNKIGVGANYIEVSRGASIAGDPYATAALDGIEAVLQGRQQHFVIEYPCHAPDRQRWFVMHVTANAAGTGGAIATHTDISDRKRVEEELQRHRCHLEDLVESRTQALEDSNRELQTAKEAAEAANRAKSIFLASMSHEMRTPLTAVLGFSQIMQYDSGLTAAQKENLEIINRSGAHLLGLINDVLDLSKIEAGQAVLNEDIFDLGRDLQTIAEMMQMRAAAKGLRFRMEQSPALPRHIKADQKKLKQIIINLAGNAVKFTESGSVVVRVSLEEAPLRLRCEVEDTGPGIAPEQMAGLFEPFSQAGENREGVGLGLFISRKLSDLMGGRISVRSEPGKGSLFIVEIPCESTDVGDSLLPKAPARVAKLAPGQPAPRILLAEDSRVNRLLMARTLVSAGFEVIEAEDGRQAVELFERYQPDLVLMDMRMPVMDGGEATQRIKSTKAGATTPVIIVSASAFEEDRLKVLASGANDFIAKPIRAEELFEKIRLHLGVAYTYWEESQDRSKVLDTAALDAMLAGVPAELLDALRAAVTASDLGRFHELMSQVAAHAPNLAAALAKLANAYEMTRLTKLLKAKEMP